MFESTSKPPIGLPQAAELSAPHYVATKAHSGAAVETAHWGRDATGPVIARMRFELPTQRPRGPSFVVVVQRDSLVEGAEAKEVGREVAVYPVYVPRSRMFRKGSAGAILAFASGEGAPFLPV